MQQMPIVGHFFHHCVVAYFNACHHFLVFTPPKGLHIMMHHVILVLNDEKGIIYHIIIFIL